VNASIELGVVSRLASLRARCAFSRHDHSISCRSSTVKWHGTSLGFADDVDIDPVCQILRKRTGDLNESLRANQAASLRRSPTSSSAPLVPKITEPRRRRIDLSAGVQHARRGVIRFFDG
jgi:hypothetical protein